MIPNKTHSYDTSAIQQRILKIMLAVDRVCREHNLTYYLWAGTQLGAVRHKGFIPWDDDADIAMPRKDYQVLMEHCDEWLPHPYSVADVFRTVKYPHYFARVQDTTTTMIIRKHLGYVEGIHIDIFPLDNVPDNALSRYFHFVKLRTYHKFLYRASRSVNKDKSRFKKAFYSFIQKFVKQEAVLLAIDKQNRKYNNKTTINCTDSFYRKSDFVPWKYLGEQVLYDFEGEKFYGVANAHKYLTDKYGDYMTLPSQEQRVQHRVDFLDFDLPFSEFDIDSI